LSIGHVLKIKPLPDLLLGLVIARDVSEKKTGLFCDLHRQKLF